MTAMTSMLPFQTIGWMLTTQEDYATTPSTDSTVTFGVASAAIVGEQYTFASAATSSWALNFAKVAVTYGSGATAVPVTLPTGPVGIDTSTNMFMTVSDTEWTALSKTFTAAGFTCDANYCSSMTTTCADMTLKSLYLNIDPTNLDNGSTSQTKFTIPPLGYTFRTQTYVIDAKCVVAITGGAEAGKATLGTYFLANYYTEFDYSTSKISFSTNSKSAWTSTIQTVLTPTLPFFSVALTNTANTWTGPLSLGTPVQAQVLAYTTASPNTLV